MNSLRKDFLPKHVALIMDGNRRWAKERRLPTFQGHAKSIDRLESLIDYAIKIGISYLTFWAFSTENWRRKKSEVEFLLELFRENLAKKVDNFHRKNVRVKVIGDLSMFPKDIQEKTRSWMEMTKNNKKITVNIALSYGGRDEIIRAIKKIQSRFNRDKIQNLTKENFGQFLDTAGQPDPDLMIRTGGEIRLSGFMLWQMEYAEFYFSKTYWPDFTPRELEKALVEYQRRKRNFGK